jgi:hypothetical protein
MSDQYDDGRYDGVPDEGGGRYYPDGILAPPEPNCLIAAGGWHAPLDTVPGWPFRPRGGTRHHHRKESTTMPKTENEIALEKARELITTLSREAELLEAKVKKERRVKAPSMLGQAGAAYSIDLRFKPGGKIYRFLLLQTPTGWYTTATGEAHSHFKSWDALLDWLDGDMIAEHTGLRRLASTQTAPVLPARTNG